MSSPGKPFACNWSSSTIHLKWILNTTNSDISHFNVKYQIDGERRWRSIDTSTKECCTVVSELKDATYHIFKVRCVMDDDTEGPFGETSDAIRTSIGGNDRNEGRDDHTAVTPGKPYGLEATATSILLGWDQPKISTKYDHFEVKYKQKGVSLWQSLTSKEPTLLLTDLKSNAKYLFRVRIVSEDGTEGPFSVVSDEIMTLQSLAGILKLSATKVDSRMPEIYTKRISRGVPEIYQIPVKREQVNNPKTMTRKCIILKGRVFYVQVAQRAKMLT